MKNLGVLLDCWLEGHSQINSVCKKVYGSLYSLYKTAGSLDQQSKKILIQTLIFPIFDYCNIIFGGAKKALCGRLQKAQNACVRFVVSVPRFEHVSPARLQLEWLSIAEREQLAVVLLVYKVMSYQQPIYLYELFNRMGSGHTHDTRNNMQLIVPRHRSDALRRSISVRGARIWNGLPDAVRCSATLSAFRNGAKGFFCTNGVIE